MTEALKIEDRMSFKFIKNIKIENIDEIYKDLSQDERSKISFLKHLANTSENDTLNKVMFDEAVNMTPKDARTYSFMKQSEHFHFKHTGLANLSLAMPLMLEKYPEGIEKSKKDIKLSHEEAFKMLLLTVNDSRRGMELSRGEAQEIHKEYYENYSELLEKYNNELKRKMFR